jgi:hypothetical protein
LARLRLRKKKRQELRQELNDVWKHKLSSQTHELRKALVLLAEHFKLLPVQTGAGFILRTCGPGRDSCSASRARDFDSSAWDSQHSDPGPLLTCRPAE